MKWTLDKIREFNAAMCSAEHRLSCITGDQNMVLLARAMGDIAAAVKVLADLPEILDGKPSEMDEAWERLVRTTQR